MKAIKVKIYLSFIAGHIALLFGLYLFISHADKTTSHFLLLTGLISTLMAYYLFFVTRKRSNI